MDQNLKETGKVVLKLVMIGQTNIKINRQTEITTLTYRLTKYSDGINWANFVKTFKDLFLGA